MTTRTAIWRFGQLSATCASELLGWEERKHSWLEIAGDVEHSD